MRLFALLPPSCLRFGAYILLGVVTSCGEGPSEPVVVAVKLAVVSQPSAAVAGSPIAPIQIAVQDASGNTVASSNATVTLALAGGVDGAILGGTVTQSAANGVATFSNLTIDKASAGYTITASSSGLTGATTSAFVVAAGAPAKVAFTVQPSSTTAGAAINPGVQVTILDARGNVTPSTAEIALSITSGTGPSGAVLGGNLAVAAAGGVATFSNLTINRAATGYTLSATSPGLSGATSTAFTVVPGIAATLVMGVQPTSITAGSSIAPGIQVLVNDAFGNLVTSSTATVTVSLTAGTGASGATLGGTLSQSAVSGVATFNSLSVDKAGTGYTLTVSSTGLAGSASSAFVVSPGVATQLAVASQPTATTAGAAINPSVTIAVRDAHGNTVTSSTATVTIAITSGTGAGGATLGGTLSQAAVGGVVTFSNLTIDKAAAGYRLAASATGLTSTTTVGFDVAAGAAARVAFIVQPSNATAGAAINPAIQVSVQDAQGNTTTSTTGVTLSLTSGTGASGANLTGTLTVAAVNGVATFSTISINKAASGYTLSAASNGLTGATSTSFTVAAAAAATLVMGVQPTSISAGSSITPGVQVALHDAFGNVATNATATVTVALTAGTGVSGATLLGTLSQAAVSGVATFGNLSVDKAASGYSLSVSSTGLSGVVTTAFSVSSGVATQLVTTVQPTAVTAGAPISPSVAIAVQDAYGNAVTSPSVTVTVAITGGSGAGGATLGGTLSQATASGIATFANLTIAKAASGYTLTASASGLSNSTTSAFSVNPDVATKVSFVVQPSNVVAGVSMNPSVKVAIQDAHGNTTTSTASVTLSITSGSGASGATMSGTGTVAASDGTATFSTLSIDKAASGYTLSAISSGLTGATSAAFTVAASAASALEIGVQPTTATAATAIAPAVQVHVRDAFGNTVTSSTATITVAITGGTGSSGATLSGTASKAAQGGAATFDNLSINKAGTGYTLSISSPGLTSAVTSAFSINAGAAAALAFKVQPTGTAQGTAISPNMEVSVTDAGGNHVGDATHSITIAITNGTGTSGAVLSGTLTRSAVSGTAVFTGTSIDRPGAAYTITATAAGLLTAISSSFNIAGGTISGTVSLSNSLLSIQSDALAVSVKRLNPDAPSISSRPRAGTKTTRWSAIGSATTLGFAAAPVLPEYVPDELIVTYKASSFAMARPSVRAMTIGSVRPFAVELARRAARLAAQHPVTLIGTSPTTLSIRLRVANSSAIETVRSAIATDTRVQAVERNALVRRTAVESYVRSILPPATAIPNDPDYPGQAWHYKAIELEHAWALTTGSSSIIVAVVDDGIRFDHPDIAPNLTTDGYDFVTNSLANFCGGGSVNLAGDGGGPDSDPTIPALFTYNAVSNCYSLNSGTGGHGLHVAGTVGAAGNNGAWGTGVSWNVRIRPVRVLNSGGTGSNWDIAQGILYAAGLPADNGLGGVQAASPARIINLSLGGPVASTELTNAVAQASANGSLLIAASGNDNVSTPMYPAAYSEVISVSAIAPDFQRASYSNYGSTIDIAAPGGQVANGSTYGVYSLQWNFGSSSATYGFLQGTSMAAPHVSGVAALILAHTPSLTAAQVRNRLEAYTVDYGIAGRDDIYGHGVLNARNSLTQTTSRTRTTKARLISATTGALVADVSTTGGAYSFADIATGSYWVFAGEDEDGDGVIGLPDRRWGAFGGTATPTAVSITGAVSQTATFTVGFPSELEPNDLSTSADVLALGGYLFGYASDSNGDYAVIKVPTSGQYTFETKSVYGACGFALELDTILDLYNSSGSLIASNDDINFNALNHCSRITMTLTAGVYYLRTTGWGTSAKRYFVTARSGS